MAKSPRHVNNGACPKCREILNRYPGLDAGLRAWFEGLQRSNQDAHVSDAGRGRARQEEYFKAGSSKARYGQSAHNYNAAVDIFRLTLSGANWDRPWFEQVVAPAVLAAAVPLTWYGIKGSKFYELPHVEVSGWREMKLKLVEE